MEEKRKFAVLLVGSGDIDYALAKLNHMEHPPVIIQPMPFKYQEQEVIDFVGEITKEINLRTPYSFTPDEVFDRLLSLKQIEDSLVEREKLTIPIYSSLKPIEEVRFEKRDKIPVPVRYKRNRFSR